MRKFLFFFICLLFYSCDPIWMGVPSYIGRWGYKNLTDTDLIIYMESIGINEWGEKCSEFSEDIIPSGKVLWSVFESSNQEDLNFYKHFLRIEETHTCKVWLANSNGSMLKLWVMGEDNGPHDVFDEEEWMCEDVDIEKTEYNREWIFTITDADIGVAE